MLLARQRPTRLRKDRRSYDHARQVRAIQCVWSTECEIHSQRIPFE